MAKVSILMLLFSSEEQQSIKIQPLTFQGVDVSPMAIEPLIIDRRAYR